MNRKPCFDEKCINCIKTIVKQQLADCSIDSLCVNGNVEVNGDLTVNGNVYYETLDVSNTCIDKLHLGTIYLQSDCTTMVGDAGTTGQVLISQGGQKNTWINSSDLAGTLDEVLQNGHTSYSSDIDMSGNKIVNVVLDALNLDCSLNDAISITSSNLILPVIIQGQTYYIQLFNNI